MVQMTKAEMEYCSETISNPFTSRVYVTSVASFVKCNEILKCCLRGPGLNQTSLSALGYLPNVLIWT